VKPPGIFWCFGNRSGEVARSIGGLMSLAGRQGFVRLRAVALRRDLIASASHPALARMDLFASEGGWLGVRDEFSNWLIQAV
jgi:hypothetical protein